MFPTVSAFSNNLLTFKGQAACPLKRLYVQSYDSGMAAKQVEALPSDEGFEVRTIPAERAHEKNASHYIQDFLYFYENNGQKYLRTLDQSMPEVSLRHRLSNYMKKLVTELSTECGAIRRYNSKAMLEGGDFFVGRRSNGDPYAIVSEQVVEHTVRLDNKTRPITEGDRKKALAKISEDLHVPQDKIISIPAPDWHLDLAMRPLAGDTILVDSPELSELLIFGAFFASRSSEERDQLRWILDKAEEHRRYSRDRGYISKDDLARLLEEEYGFRVVRVPGVLNPPLVRELSVIEQMNLHNVIPRTRKMSLPQQMQMYSLLNTHGLSTVYINATVHQRDDGGLSFITNASAMPTLDREFAEVLKAANVGIDRVYFISGEKVKNQFGPGMTNEASLHLARGGGGFHCVSVEEPDFEKWKQRLQPVTA